MISEDVERVAQVMAEGAGFAWSACAQSQWIRDARIGLAAFFRNRVPSAKELDVVERTICCPRGCRKTGKSPTLGISDCDAPGYREEAERALQASGAFIAGELEKMR